MHFHTQIISASSSSISRAITNGNFRQDLKYRLEVIPLELPPLRARHDDIVPLFTYFLEKQFFELSQRPRKMHKKVIEFIKTYPWPGNVREMLNVCIYIAATAQTKDGDVDIENLPSAMLSDGKEINIFTATQSVETTHNPHKSLTAECIRGALAQYEGNKSRAARMLGVSRMTLWRKIKQFGIA